MATRVAAAMLGRARGDDSFLIVISGRIDYAVMIDAHHDAIHGP